MTALRRTAAALAGLATVVTVGVAPASGAAYSTWSGTVTKGADGDTSYIDIGGDGVGPVKVRNAGIQAMEIGQCGAATATARLKQLVLGKKVRLSAEYASSASNGRPLRFLDLVSSTGTTDVQLAMLKDGLVLWENIKQEDSRSATYHRAMEDAAAARKGLWSGACGAGPSTAAQVKMWVNYDGDGDDKADPNVEYVRLLNTGSTDVPLGGWWVREATQLTLRFPSGTVLKPGAYLTVHVGKGTATGSRFYWGEPGPIFGNISSPAAAGDLGDGAYLFDPHGDIRSHVTYPCVRSCTDPAAGRLAIGPVVYDAPGDDAVHPNGESISLSVVGTSPVDLTRKVLVLNSRVMEMPVGTVLQPGEKLVVRSGTGTSSRLVRYWQSSSSLLSNSGGVVTLRNTEGTPLTCRSWAGGRC